MTKSISSMIVTLLVVTAGGCSRPQTPSVKRIAAGSEYSGFLKDYAKLQPVKGMDDMARGYAATDAQKNLHKYIAVVVDPVDVYLASDADGAKLTETARSAATEYFRAALVKAVSGAYPVVEQPGPLVLRLRSAIVGVDFGGEVAAGSDSLKNTVDIEKVRVEMELLDSESGDQIAALVDAQNLGQGAQISSTNSREERWEAAREAFDGWAGRVREFLDTSVELSPADSERAIQSYVPYGSQSFK